MDRKIPEFLFNESWNTTEMLLWGIEEEGELVIEDGADVEAKEGEGECDSLFTESLLTRCLIVPILSWANGIDSVEELIDSVGELIELK